MEYYLLGAIVAFLINVIKLFINIITGSSQRIKNIKKIGGYYNITEGQITKDKPSIGKLVFYLGDTLLITPLLSWLYVGYYMFSLIKAKINKLPVPEKLKEITFKLSSIDLPEEQVKECLNDISRFYYGQEVDFRIPYEDEYDKDTYSITYGEGINDWNVDLLLDKNSQMFIINALDPDFGKHVNKYEYKFEGTEMLTRSIETKHTYLGNVKYDIKNGVVQEQDYRDRQKEGLANSPEEVDEKVEQLYDRVEWGKIYNPGIKYFILFRHADILDDEEARKFFKSEHERIIHGFKRIEEYVNKLDCYIGKDDYIPGNTILYNSKSIPENITEEVNDLLYGDKMVRFNISDEEFRNKERLVEDFERYLSKL